ncbi:MAG TPA: hypothetical protein VI341_13700 [Actinomycetota bacterium]
MPDTFADAVRVAIAESVAERHTEFLAFADAYTISESDPYARAFAIAYAFGLAYSESHTFANRVAEAYASADGRCV